MFLSAKKAMYKKSNVSKKGKLVNKKHCRIWNGPISKKGGISIYGKNMQLNTLIFECKMGRHKKTTDNVKKICGNIKCCECSHLKIKVK